MVEWLGHFNVYPSSWLNDLSVDFSNSFSKNLGRKSLCMFNCLNSGTSALARWQLSRRRVAKNTNAADPILCGTSPSSSWRFNSLRTWITISLRSISSCHFPRFFPVGFNFPPSTGMNLKALCFRLCFHGSGLKYLNNVHCLQSEFLQFLRNIACFRSLNLNLIYPNFLLLF